MRQQVNVKRVVTTPSIVASCIFTLLPLAACAPILGLTGFTNPLVQALATQLDQIKLVGDAVSYMATGKTVSDHVLSRAVGEDCRIFNIASGVPVCSPLPVDPQNGIESVPVEYITTENGGGFAAQFVDPEKSDAVADGRDDQRLTNLERVVERTDCKTGTDQRYARIAFEARGGQVTSFAYYSMWKARTCSLDFERNAPGTEWSRTPEGDTRIDTAQGRFVIRTLPDSYVFEFKQVPRQKFCGMFGEINGSMIVKRGTGAAECSAAGILDSGDEPLESL